MEIILIALKYIQTSPHLLIHVLLTISFVYFLIKKSNHENFKINTETNEIQINTLIKQVEYLSKELEETKGYLRLAQEEYMKLFRKLQILELECFEAKKRLSLRESDLKSDLKFVLKDDDTESSP